MPLVSKERITELEEMSVEISKTELQRIKMTGIQELWDNYERCNIYIWYYQKEKKEKEWEKYLKDC